MRSFLTAVLLLLLCNFCAAQKYGRKKDQQRLLIVSPALNYQGQWFGELNLMLSSFESGGPCNPPVLYGPRIGVEANFSKNRFIYAPKIGYEFNALLIAVRGNVVSYIDNDQIDLRILPEIGLSMLGGVNIMYGYNIPTLNFRSPEINKHRISFTINLDPDLWRQ